MRFLFLIAASMSLQLYSQSKAGINIQNMDRGIKPGDDFYMYCNGTWQKNFQLPESDARYGSFNEIHNNNLKRIKVILNEIAINNSAAAGSDMQKIRDFYNSAMDSAKLEEDRWKPIKPMMAKIDSVKDARGLFLLKSELDYMGVNLYFTPTVAPDLKNSKKNRLYLLQGGYGLGDRDYYHLPKHEKIRTEYLMYLTNLFSLIRFTEEEARIASEELMNYEKNICVEAFSRVELRDPEKNYNPVSFKQLKQLTPNMDWEAYFKSKNIAAPDTIILGKTSYIKQLDVLLTKAPLALLKLYAKAQLVMTAAPFLSQRFQLVDFNFRGTVLSGAKQIKPRWERAFNTINASMGELFSKEYVKRHFSAEAKANVNKLIDHLVVAYRGRIASRSWMSPQAKAMANKKLDLMIRKIAYPDKWKDYKGMEIANISYWDNVCRARSYEHQDNLADLKKPVDRKKWQMTPVTVNAYYDPSTNEITFPAAILQPPFYDPKADDAANYGTMGSIIGHELTHGFDDQGSKFDAYGNLKTWWLESDQKNFEERSKLMAEQFNQFTMLDSLHVNGELTLGENLADLGGLTLSFLAYKRSLAGKASPVLEGLSGEQRFFIAWTQGWKSKVRDEEIRRLLTLDYHAPAYLRAFAPLRNLGPFYEAFGIKAGDKMFLEENKRVEIW
ncbi:MAG TPA: M13 family metallopeptidase [Bacteroidia bacterium]|nr:M13 family metallopeptidase [Bacteroidia bacterium]